MKFLKISILTITALALLFGEMAYAQKSRVLKRYDKGMELAAKGEFILAQDEFLQAVSIDPTLRKAGYRLEIVKRVLDKELDEQAARHSFKGIGAAKRGMLDESIIELTRAIEIEPKFVDAYVDRGLIYSLKRKPKKAIADFSRAIVLDGDHIDAYLNRAQAHLQNGQPDLAVWDYTKALEYLPDDAEIYYNRGKIYNKAGRYQIAVDDYGHAIKRNPSYAEVYNDRGLIYLQQYGSSALGCADWEIACDLGLCNNYNQAKKKNVCY